MHLEYSAMKKERQFFKEDVCFKNLWLVAMHPLNNTDYDLLGKPKGRSEQFCEKVYRMRLRLVMLAHQQ